MESRPTPFGRRSKEQHMKKQITASQAVIRTERNLIAGLLSILPGLGHIYKGLYANGLVVMLLITPIVVWASVLLSLTTKGAGLLMPIAYWAIVAYQAMKEPDQRKHHLLYLL
jgi:hypothetical protein